MLKLPASESSNVVRLAVRLPATLCTRAVPNRCCCSRAVHGASAFAHFPAAGDRNDRQARRC